MQEVLNVETCFVTRNEVDMLGVIQHSKIGTAYTAIMCSVLNKTTNRQEYVDWDTFLDRFTCGTKEKWELYNTFSKRVTEDEFKEVCSVTAADKTDDIFDVISKHVIANI